MMKEAPIPKEAELDVVSIVEKSIAFLSKRKQSESAKAFEAQSKLLKVGGHSVNVYDSAWTNKYDAKTKTIVFIHGAGGQLSMWAEQARRFEKDYRVIAYDLMGHGKTDTTKFYSDMRLYAKDLEDLLNVLGVDPNNTILVGYSLGANVAYKFAQTHKVDRTAFIGMHLSKNYVKMSYRTLSLIIGDAVTREWPEYRHKTTTIGFTSAVFSYMNEKEVLPQVGDIPTLIINGKKDKMTPMKEAERLSKQIPNSEFIIFPTASHDVQTQPEFDGVLRKFIEGKR